jgi:hypothetical protein
MGKPCVVGCDQLVVDVQHRSAHFGAETVHEGRLALDRWRGRDDLPRPWPRHGRAS